MNAHKDADRCARLLEKSRQYFPHPNARGARVYRRYLAHTIRFKARHGFDWTELDCPY